MSFATVEPTDAVEVTAWAFCSASAGQFPYAGIYYDSSSTPLDWQLVGGVNNSGAGGNSRLSKTWFPGTSSAVSYYYRWACQSGTVYVASYLGTNFCGERIRMKGRVIRS